MHLPIGQKIRSIKDAAIKTLKKIPPSIPNALYGAILGVLGTLFVKGYFKPKLFVQVAYTNSVTFRQQDQPPRFVALLLDRLPNGEAQVVAPRTITFKSERDFSRVQGGSQIMKVLLLNSGQATAKRIRIGLVMGNDWKLAASPNVEITSDKAIESAVPPYHIIEIARLTSGELAVLTVTGSCGCSSSVTTHAAKPDALFIPTEKQQEGYAPILFITDEDGSAVDENAISMKNALEQERLNVPNANVGFRAEGLRPKPGVSPDIQPIEHFTFDVEHKDKDGKTQTTTLSTDRPIKFEF